MGFCTSCGHQIGVGRSCPSCGHPSTGERLPASGPPTSAGVPSTDTAERPAVGAWPVGDIPFGQGPRYPLYADESPPRQRVGGSPPSAATTTAFEVTPAVRREGLASAAPAPPPGPGPRRSAPWQPFAVLGLVLLLVLVLGAWLATRGGDTSADRTRTENGMTGPVAAPDDIIDLTPGTRASAPATAPPTASLSGERVTFDAANMLDGRPETAWRVSGDGSGRVLRFDLPQESVITEVGLINGYAKTDEGPKGATVRWYDNNRRIHEVTWILGDGTRLVQHLQERQEMQTIEIDPIRTSRIRLRIDRVSAPGRGPRGRNFTPISEVSIAGGPES